MRPATFDTTAQLKGHEMNHTAVRVANHPGAGHSIASTSPDRISATISVTGTITGFSRSEIYRLLAAGHLKAVKRGRKTLILMGSVTDYLASLPRAEFGGGAG